VPATPAAGEPRESAADEIAGEMLYGHAGRPALPALAEVSEIGQHEIPQDGGHGEISEQPVQDSLRGRFIESVQSLPERSGRPILGRRGERRPGRAGGAGYSRRR
jgi:hypothetical protein